MKISWTAGHALVTKGKEDPEGMKEWSYSSPIVIEAMRLLAQYQGVEQKRFDDPTGKVDISLDDRSDAINDWKPDLHMDVHLNAFGTGGWNETSGTETFVHSSKPKDAQTLAAVIQNNLLRELGLKNRGVKYENFHMLREVKSTAVLPEIAFMTNKGDAFKMRKPEYQNKAAKAIVDAIVSVYKLKLIEAKYSGWKKSLGVWYFYEKGSVVKNRWIETKDKWYWLKADGKMAENEWVKYKEKWYYLGAGGAMYEDGIFKVKDEYYFFNKEGDMVVDSSRPVKFGPDGKIIVG